MPFKIIRTVEKGKPQLCVVPSSWENKGVLQWPKKASELKLVRHENSVPKPDWTNIICTVKRNHLRSYDAANEELKLMITQTDTEQEDEVVRRQPPLQDFNDYAEQLVLNQDIDGGSSNMPTIASGAQSTDTYYVINNIETPEITLPETYTDTKTILQNQTIMFSIMNQVVDNQKKIIQKLATLSVQIEEFSSNTEVTTLKEASKSGDSTSFTIKRITKIEDLEELEERLSDADYKNKFMKSCLIICNGGLGDATNCAYRFLDVLFSREFLCQCSWSGGTRGEGVKISMKCYKRTLSFFFQMIKQWDSSYTIEANELFFKNVLKNAKKRTNVTYQRLPTKRRRSKAEKHAKKQKSNDGAEINRENIEKSAVCENNQAVSEREELSNDEIEKENIKVANIETPAKKNYSKKPAKIEKVNVKGNDDVMPKNKEIESGEELNNEEIEEENIKMVNIETPAKKNNNKKPAKIEKVNVKGNDDVMPKNKEIESGEELNNEEIEEENIKMVNIETPAKKNNNKKPAKIEKVNVNGNDDVMPKNKEIESGEELNNEEIEEENIKMVNIETPAKKNNNKKPAKIEKEKKIKKTKIFRNPFANI